MTCNRARFSVAKSINSKSNIHFFIYLIAILLRILDPHNFVFLFWIPQHCDSWKIFTTFFETVHNDIFLEARAFRIESGFEIINSGLASLRKWSKTFQIDSLGKNKNISKFLFFFLSPQHCDSWNFFQKVLKLSIW